MKYLIKKTYTSTENNKNYEPGTVRVYYCGAYGATQLAPTDGKEFFLNWYIKGKAYSSKAGLSKALKEAERSKQWEEEHGFYTVDLEVVEVEE